MADKPAVSTVTQRTNAISVGLMLILLYMCSVISVVVSFSAYVLRTDWSDTIALEDAGIRDIDYLIYLVRQDSALSAQVQSIQEQIEEANSRLDETSTRIEVLRFNLSEAVQELNQSIQAAKTYLADAGADLSEADAEDLANLLSTELPLQTVVVQGLSRIEKVAFQPATAQSLQDEARSRAQQLSAEITTLNTTFQRVQTDLRTAEQDQRRWDTDRTDYLKVQGEKQAALAELRQTLPVASVHRGRWNGLSEAGWYNPMPRLVALPTILLTLIATIAAGALGTLVAFSRSTFQEKHSLDGSALLINVGEGIAAAIGVFLFAGAGMLVLTQGAGPEGRLELSPFTVAFLAFFSGFMAEAAFTKITNFGRDLFGQKQSRKAGGEVDTGGGAMP
jgi:peptidoglycan hydrolase CwlO-like protein